MWKIHHPLFQILNTLEDSHIENTPVCNQCGRAFIHPYFIQPKLIQDGGKPYVWTDLEDSDCKGMSVYGSLFAVLLNKMEKLEAGPGG